ncbi:MAG: FtsX-like permease family protein [Romboutsia sp.]|uniref:FtsX-like permease family protein n=1 Tax=Romboutsia sp. TaxID=1965302 RepID=UPI003F3EC183
MYSKIALGNVKKSFKDYSIYFLTLTLAVCVFYSFNSIESQKGVLEMSASDSKNLDMMMELISMMSVFVSFILGGLIVYANNFLIKRRKKELGIYMTLGMGKGKISRILVVETLIVGIVSLISGLALGLVLSQGLSVFTSKLFEVSMTEYQFIISQSAIGKTILYFGIIFILVMILNTIIISRYKIIDLLTSGRKNENIKIKNSLIYVLIFIIAATTLGVAYKLVLEAGLNISDVRFKISILLGVVGTVLVFFSLAGFGLSLIQKSPNLYFKELNIFILRQINSKVNTNFISMSAICLMLFLTMGILSTGISFKDALQNGLQNTTPFDYTGIMYLYEEDKIKSIEESLNNIEFKFDDNEKYAYYFEYRLDGNLKDLFGKYIKEDQMNEFKKFDNMRNSIIKLSDYNEIRKLDGKEALSLDSNEVLFTSNESKIVDTVNNILKDNNKLSLENKEYTIKNKEVITDAMRTTGYSDNIFTIIVNDDIVKYKSPITSYLNVNYDPTKKEEAEKKYVDLGKGFMDRTYDFDKAGFIVGYTKDQVYADNKGMTTTVLFIGIYLGIVFLISSMAVLSLQQLSEASDSIDRYKSLKRLGANDKMINKTIFIQTLIYFTLPLVLAFIHSVVGIKVANEFITMFGKPDIGSSALMTAGIFIVIYLGYFYATYTGYKNIVKNS